MIHWIRLLHPLLAVLAIYPLVGVAIFLGVQTGQRRSGNRSIPASVGSSHTELGLWLSNGLVVMVLVGLAASAISHTQGLMTPVGHARSFQLIIGFSGTAMCLLSLAFASETSTRLSLAVLTWLGVISLAAQPELGHPLGNPLHLSFWQGHTWPGIILTGIMLFAFAIRRETSCQRNWRRVHLILAIFASFLFVAQAVTGIRDLATSRPHTQLPLALYTPPTF